MGVQSTHKGAPDARPRPPSQHRAVRRAPAPHLRLGGHVPLRQAGAGGDPRAPPGPLALHRGLAPALDHAAAPEAKGPAAASAGRRPQAAPAQLRRCAGEPGLLPLRPAALHRGARGAALHAHAALRAPARAGLPRRSPGLAHRRGHRPRAGRHRLGPVAARPRPVARTAGGRPALAGRGGGVGHLHRRGPRGGGAVRRARHHLLDHHRRYPPLPAARHRLADAARPSRGDRAAPRRRHGSDSATSSS